MKKLFVILCLFIAAAAFSQDFSVFSKFQGKYLGLDTPGKTPKKFKVEGLDHKWFFFFSEGSECLFIGKGGIFYSKMERGKWAQPVNTGIYGGYMDFEPNISPDGKKII
ncbi:hypothetical protein ACFL4T_12260, partial [candidate division KSB1 bacterium]